MRSFFLYAGLWLLVPAACQRPSGHPTPVRDFSAVDNLLSDQLSGSYRGGVVCIVQHEGQRIYEKEAGDLTKISSELVASVTKTFSAAVLLSLVDEGKIRLDDSVGRYLPVFTQNRKGHITIRQLFSHTSGLPDDERVGSRNQTLAQVVDNIARTVPLVYRPGSAFSYGGTSMHVAGRIAEVAGGKPWNDLFQERIAGPCGLMGSSFRLTTPANPRIAGGMASTPEDIIRFAEMIRRRGVGPKGQRILSEKAIEEFWKDQTNRARILFTPYPIKPAYNNPYRADTIRYGLGSWLDVYNPQTSTQEQISGIGAFGTYFWIDRKRDLTGVVFTQSTLQTSLNTTFQIIDAVREAIDK